VVSGCRCGVSENCTLLAYCAATSGNFLQKFRDNLSAPDSGFKNKKNCFRISFGILDPASAIQ